MPPARIQVGDIIQVQIRTTVENQQCMNVLYYRAISAYPAVPYESSLSDLLNVIEVDAFTGVVPAMTPAMAPNATVTHLIGQRVYPTRDFYVVENVGAAGTHVDDCDATNVSAVITKRVDRTGRGRSGSFHLPGVPNTGYSFGSLTPVYKGLVTQIASTLRAKQLAIAADTGYEPITFRADVGTPDNFSRLIATTVQDTLRVMRRRTVGVGI